ncbi:MAG: alpha-galactosidase [Muribaculaceae bacterium]|nr:alpha-galactosidase [Muribaculaceae bacterium]
MTKRIIIMLAVLAVAMSSQAQRTPTMGWSSWNTFALDINERLIRQQAEAMHQSGLQDAGYLYINIDDGYWQGRGEDGHLRLNTERFPGGMRALVDYIHSLGLKAGIYSDAGDNTCGSGNRQPWGVGVGLAGHEEQDCQLYFRDWDFDFIKVDYCGGRHLDLDEREQYTRISNAIRNCGKPGVVFNICRWAYPGTWVADVADSWRTTGDIYDAWKSVKEILAENLYMSAYCHDGHYNDMDMLEVGRSMSQTEDETHFGMWCIMSSPLLIGCDMAKIKPQSLKLLTNRDLIALNQDPLHLQAYLAAKQGECYVLVKDIKQLQGKERAFAVYNPSDKEQTVILDFQTIDLGGRVEMYDCIAQSDAGRATGSVTVKVPAHGTRIYRAKGEKRLERKVYEAETAFLSQYQELHLYYDVYTGSYIPKDNASGGYVACYLGYRPGNDLQWRHVNVNQSGPRTMTIHFYAGNWREFNVEVNGKQVGTYSVNGKDWNKPQTIKVDIDLQKGDNVIRLWNDGVWLPDIDMMELN